MATDPRTVAQQTIAYNELLAAAENMLAALDSGDPQAVKEAETLLEAEIPVEPAVIVPMTLWDIAMANPPEKREQALQVTNAAQESITAGDELARLTIENPAPRDVANAEKQQAAREFEVHYAIMKDAEMGGLEPTPPVP